MRLIFHKLAEKGLPKKSTGLFFFMFSGFVDTSVVKNIDISISIDTEISERYQY